MQKQRWLLVVVASGCIDAQERPDETLASTSDAISGGGLVTVNNDPVNAAVKILHPFTTGEQCSGVKVGARRFLTAAHCAISTWTPGQVVFISNALNPLPDDGVSPRWTRVTLTNVFIHPSFVADPEQSSTVSSEHSYDVAVFDIAEATAAIPTAGPMNRNHVFDDLLIFSVGYGANTRVPGRAGQKQSAAYSSTRAGASDARYAHQLLAVETGDDRQGSDGGDSGGPAFGFTTTYQLIGLNQNGTAKGRPATLDPLSSGFTRLANVQRWLDAPHNGSTTFSGLGFLQNRLQRQCALAISVSAGSLPQLGECEGYDPSIHSQLWDLVPVPNTTSFQIKTRAHSVNRCFDLSGSNVVLQTCNAARAQQRWVASPVDNSGLYYFIINQSDPANGVLTKITGSVPPLTLRVGATTLGNQRHWLFYR